MGSTRDNDIDSTPSDAAREFPFVGKVLVVALVLILVFAVAQPMLWRWLFDTKPPTGSRDLGATTEIVVTILSIGLGVFGLILYQVAEKSIQERVAKAQERFEQQATAAAAEFQRAVDEVNERRVSDYQDLALAQGRLLIGLSNLAWLAYEEPWRAQGYTNESEIAGFHRMADSAAKSARNAGKVMEPLVADKGKAEDVQLDVSRVSANNLAYHLATLRRPEDRDEALRLVESLELPRGAVTPVHAETIAWVCLRYGTNDSAMQGKARDRLRYFLNHPHVDDARRTRIREKYEKLGLRA